MVTLRKLHHGFTLLELLIALSIFAIIGVAAYRLLSGEVNLQQILIKNSDHLYQWQRGMRRLSEDLQQTTSRPIRLEYGDEEAAFFGDSEQLRFTRQGWPNPMYKSRSQLQRVEYRLESALDDAGKSYQFLQRRVWPVLDRAPDSEALEQILLSGVTDIRWRYLDNEKEWHNQWPADTQSESAIIELPQAVELTLYSERWGEIHRLIVIGAYQPTPPLTDESESGS